jgi:HEAT repeat protein
MSTLDALRLLSDGKFHRLGDDLLRRLEPRYRRLRTHGLNEEDESIKGQPDSYVGDTANSCTVAVCYTTERQGWWNKVVQDVKDVVSTSPSVEEIVAVIPHNADRDGPKKASVDWLSKARAGAGAASFRLIDGRDLSHYLDTDHQDLRYEHLRIPYSRLSAASILASSRIGTASALEAIRASGRYDPTRYAARSADRELYHLWQSCLREDRLSGGGRIAPVRMIGLVNDSGVGKTSLICSFAESLAAVLPVLLVQARDLSLATEDALVAHTIHALQGVLEPAVRVAEEAALTKHLAGAMPLTLILDGLDEAHNPDAVRKAITFWLRSRLGQVSVLIVTSRPEFWRTCHDLFWKRWMPRPATADSRSPVKVSGSSPDDAAALDGEARLPDRFTDAELEAAWVRAGQQRADLYALRAEAREELRHPFTLRVYLDLCSQGGSRPPVVTRSDLMESWLSQRLQAEAVPTERITPQHFQQALRIVATRIDAAKSGSISVDELRDAPRFDPTHPPGPVVQRLIDTNILESLLGDADRIRFAVEAVQDFYRAEADVEDIRADPAAVGKRFTELRFTDAYPRLLRVGRRLANDTVRHLFVQQLAATDPRKAAVVLGGAPLQYAPEVRAEVAEALGQDILASHRVRAAFAITLLGDLDCPEVVDVLRRRLFPPAAPHRYLNSVGARAFAKLGDPAAAEFVYRWDLFGVDYYFPEKLSLFRQARPEFQHALGDYAARHLISASETREHARAVSVLAYLGDERLVEHLRERIAENRMLEEYENHALVALGSRAAGALFVQSVRSVGEQLATISDDAANNDKRYKLTEPLSAHTADIRYLVTQVFENYLLQLIEDKDHTISWIGCGWAKGGRVASLLHAIAVASARHKWVDYPDRMGARSIMTADLWLDCWRAVTDSSVRKELLKLLPLYPTAKIEEVLLDCLESRDFRNQAARALGEYGALRSAPLLRRTLLEESGDDTKWDKMAAADALGRLRDEAAIPLLQSLAVEHPNSDAALFAITSLGSLGTPEAEAALCDLLRRGVGEDRVVQGLILCGSQSALAISIAKAKEKPEGPRWLCEQLGCLSWIRGWRRGQYYTHIHTAELVEYLEATYQPGSPTQNWKLVDSFRQIDSPDVRRLLRKWAERRGTAEDPLVREDRQSRMSAMCYWELAERGDESAIAYVLENTTSENDAMYVHIAEYQLPHFRSSAVAAEVRQRLSVATTQSQIVRMLSLLGRFGDPSDAELLRQFLTHSDDLVANVACESLLRLTDPLLVPEDWREV